MSTTFQLKVKGAIGTISGSYLWSNAANWTAGVPVTGSSVIWNVSGSNDPGGYDDIAGLNIANIAIQSGDLAAAAGLTVGTVAFSGVVNEIYADTLAGTGPATLTIGAITGSGNIGAVGTGAVTSVTETTDPGETYYVKNGGELILAAAPIASSILSYGGGNTGTLAFKTLGGTVSAALSNVAVGDSLALPGSVVDSVTFGTSSLTIVTNLGTTTFSNVTYGTTTPTGYSVGVDAVTGLQSITFTTPTAFQKVTASAVANFPNQFLWSTAVNWTAGLPVNASTIAVNVGGGGYDDITGLSLAQVQLSANLKVAAALTVVDVEFFGYAGSSTIASNTLAGAGPVTLTIDNITNATVGSYGSVGAVGTGAVTNVLAASDLNEDYFVDQGGELILTAAPGASATFFYDNSFLPSGTLAFKTLSGTVSGGLIGVSVGDSMALPGSTVYSVTFGASSLTIVTDLGTTTFTGVTYGTTTPTGYSVGVDAVTGLQSITFTTPTSFKQTTSSSFGTFSGTYLWSNAANWTSGIPVNGSSLIWNIPAAAGNPSGYDNIANLSLANIEMQQGYLAVSADLTTVNVASSGNTEIFTDTLGGTGPATLTIDNITGANGWIGAVGAGAVTNVLAATDPGEIYFAEEGGELILTAAPNASSYLEYSNAYSTGTLAFETLSGTVSAALWGVEVGDSMALPGSTVYSVTFGTSSMTIVTDLGTTTFSNVSYGTAKPTGYSLGTDPTTGLQLITFTTPTAFEQTTSSSFGAFSGTYLWSNSANWTSGAPVNGSSIIWNIPNANGNPSGYDNVANLSLANIQMQQGYLAVSAQLTAVNVAFSGNSEIFTDTLGGTGPATLTIDNITGANGWIGAVGAGAVTNVLATSDPGEVYGAEEAGKLVLTAAPNASSYLEYSNTYSTGTLAFKTLSGTVNAALWGVEVGDSMELPGSAVSSVTFGASSMTLVTNLGAIRFSNVSYGTTKPTGFATRLDAATGLIDVTFLGVDPTLTGGGYTVGLTSGLGYQVNLSNTANIWDNVTGSGGTVSLTNAQANVTGGGDTINFQGATGNASSLYNSGSNWDTVNGSNGTVSLYAVAASVIGGGDTIYFQGATGNAASLYNSGGNWDTVYGSNGTVSLYAVAASVIGGGDTIYFQGATGNAASLYNSGSNWDTVYGSNGTVSLNAVAASVIGGGDTIYFQGATGNAASLYNSGGNWDTIKGSNGTVSLNAVAASVIGGGDTIYFQGATGNAASLYATNGSADQINGSNGTISLNSAQATANGNDETVYFSGSNSLTANGTSEAFVFQPTIGQNTISGFSSTDSIQLSKSDFADWNTLLSHTAQSGANTVITLDASDTITLTGVTATNLTSSEFHLV